jgi:hypothetical protein
LITGIALTLGGMGITRRWKSAWLFLVAWTGYEASMAAMAALGLLPARAPAGTALILIFLAAALFLLLLRIGLALWRAPPRDASRLRELVRLEAERARSKGAA